MRDNAGLKEMLAGQFTLDRVCVPEDTGPAIASLLSDANRGVKAQRIEISGGMFL